MENAYEFINNLIREGCMGEEFFHEIIKEKYLIESLESNLDQKKYFLKTFNLDKGESQLFELEHLTLLKKIE